MAVGSFKLPITASASGDWVRPSDWLAMPTGITSANQTFVGLHAVIEDNDNYVAFLFTTSAGQYQVDWGDGSTPTLHNSNTIAQYQYNFATVSSSTLTSRGYKQCIITVTPVSGNLLSCNFQQRFVTSPVQNQAYSTGFLDCILSMPNASATGLAFGGTTVRHTYVERFDIKTIGNVTNINAMFQGLSSLQSLPLFDTTNVTNMSTMFNACNSIKLIPLFNTSNVTSMGTMFSNCLSLKEVPLFNTASVTNMSQMFQNCLSLQNVPLFNTSNVTTMGTMFQNCNSLQSVPLFNTAKVTNMDNCFGSCQSLNSIPSFTFTVNPSFGGFFANGSSSLNRCQISFFNSVNLSTCQLSQTALVEIFTNLVDRTLTTAANINITGNWGASALSVGDRLIATAKNWTITG